MALSTIRRKKLGLFAVFCTFLIDALSWSIVFPIFAPFFLDVENHLFSASMSIATRTTILGLFLAAFSLGQFIGAPLLGEFADRRGRKKTLSISVFFTLVGLALTAWSIQSENLYFLFVSRILTGIFAGNMSICMACIADLCPEQEERIKQFGKISVISGISFILGAFLGGKLSDPTVSSLFFPALPLWLATCLTLVNFFFVLFAFPETMNKQMDEPMSVRSYFSNMRKALRGRNVQSMYAIYFLFLFAWTLVLQFVPVLMVRHFHFTNSNLGDLALFMGICWASGSGVLNHLLVKCVSSIKIMEGCLLFFTVLCFLLIFPMPIYKVLAVMAFCVIVGGLAWPHCSGMISQAAPAQMQGNFMGLSQSLQSLAMGIAPAIGGVAYQGFSGFPFLLGALATLTAAILYFCMFHVKNSR
ncbi:MAG TPA: MFS transporter [Chlamydiales bacterium]|jgi:DHA1 family tetracycline resistance protein-like MFS transporter|nr:MFS transporter [Chlamydiales bacterium]